MICSAAQILLMLSRITPSEMTQGDTVRSDTKYEIASYPAAYIALGVCGCVLVCTCVRLGGCMRWVYSPILLQLLCGGDCFSKNCCIYSVGETGRSGFSHCYSLTRYVAFAMGDGDNLQWVTGGFIGGSGWWAAPERGCIPFGWGLPLSSLMQVDLN